MQVILAQRWRECVICVNSGAPLAATVMMGGILEGLLLATINQLSNMAPVFTATSAPRDKLGKTLPLKDWTLKNNIDVAHELKWITTAAKDISEVMRDYRNYIHPQKELSHGVTLVEADAQMLWEIAKKMIFADPVTLAKLPLVHVEAAASPGELGLRVAMRRRTENESSRLVALH